MTGPDAVDVGEERKASASPQAAEAHQALVRREASSMKQSTSLKQSTAGQRPARPRSPLDADPVAAPDPIVEVLKAIAMNQILPHYQPLVSIPSGRLIGVEALARWEHPDHGRLPPTAFVPALERARRVTDLTAHMVERACGDLADWRRRFRLPDPFTMAVNISATELGDPRLIRLVTDSLRRHCVPPGALCLEVTETAAIDDLAASAAVCHELRALGVRLAIDDFGAAHASQRYFDVLPFDVVKIDQSYVAQLGLRPDCAAFIARTVASAGGAIEVVAEGVETAEQAAALRQLGCRNGQGFGFGRPGPGDDVLAAFMTLSCSSH